MIGKTLNQYQITAALGAGGMGEVFRARDTRLNRDVAVKELPKDFVAEKNQATSPSAWKSPSSPKARRWMKPR